MDNLEYQESLKIEKKILFLKEIICKSMTAIQKFKLMDIYGANELNICVSSLEKVYEDLNKIYDG